MEEWEKILDILTPANLADLGDPDYSVLADCLGVYNEYQVLKLCEYSNKKIKTLLL